MCVRVCVCVCVCVGGGWLCRAGEIEENFPTPDQLLLKINELYEEYSNHAEQLENFLHKRKVTLSMYVDSFTVTEA